MYLPIWSVGLMLVIVFLIAGGIIAAVLALGGNNAPGGSPVIMVIPPAPTERSDSFALSPATPTIPPALDPLIQHSGPIVLAGPTLATQVLTPTPLPIIVGSTVEVFGVRPDQLNVRDRPGVNGTTIIMQVPEGSLFTAVEGPVQADGISWWRIQDPFDPSRAGWAASNYLRAVQ